MTIHSQSIANGAKLIFLSEIPLRDIEEEDTLTAIEHGITITEYI